MTAVKSCHYLVISQGKGAMAAVKSCRYLVACHGKGVMSAVKSCLHLVVSWVASAVWQSVAVGLGNCCPLTRRRPQHSAAQQGSETQQRDVQLRKDEDELSVWSLYMCIYLHNLHAGQA